MEGRSRSKPAGWWTPPGAGDLLARQLGLHSRAPHQRSAFWFRLVDFDPSILDRIHALKKVNWAYDSYYCTHHFFGKGNWVWLIPVRSEDSRRMISIGLTYRPDLFPGEVTTTREFMDWMAGEHPLVGDFVKSGEIVDTNVYRNYMYRAKRRYSSRGWFLIGDAADTVDPLYSTGLALASLSIQQVGAMVRRDLEGKLSEAYVEDLDRAYAGVHGTSSHMVGTLYEVMEDGFQCHLRMNLSISTMFHLAIPLILNGYYTDSVGARLAARFGGPTGMIRQLRRFDPLIARAARQTFSCFTRALHQGSVLIYPELSLLRVPPGRGYPQVHLPDVPAHDGHAPAPAPAGRNPILVRPGSTGSPGPDPPVGGAVACFGRRSLKNSRLIRWMVAPGPGTTPEGRFRYQASRARQRRGFEESPIGSRLPDACTCPDRLVQGNGRG